ncbi:MAG: circularly permuted type 2 ATP-grasp protein [Actinomycetes bacterium]
MATQTAPTPWADYAPAQAWDEAMDVNGVVREPYEKVYAEIATMSGEDLHSRAEALANTYLAQGVTFDHAGVVWGLSSATTSRDDAWHFMELGRSLERADMIARLLMTRSLEGTIGPNWTTLLRSCSAHEAYLRTVRSLVTEDRAAEFLIVDRIFPRSIAYNLDKAETTLTLIEPGTQRDSVTDQARLALGRARTNLEYQRIGDILANLPQQMQDVQRACALASDLIRDRFFLPASSAVWSQEAV